MTPELLASLAVMSGRCRNCGWHPANQNGHHPDCTRPEVNR